MKKDYKTHQEAWDDLAESWHNLLMELAKSIGLVKFVDWLEKKLGGKS